MNRKRYSLFHTRMQNFASSRPGAWFYARVLHVFDRLAVRMTGGRKTLTAGATGLPVLMVTTTGAKSGMPRTVPLLYIRDERSPNSFALIASNWGQDHHPAWYYNLKKNPHAICAIEGKSSEYIAHEAIDEEYERFWQYAEDIYTGYPLYKRRASERHIPIMVMTPA